MRYLPAVLMIAVIACGAHVQSQQATGADARLPDAPAPAEQAYRNVAGVSIVAERSVKPSLEELVSALDPDSGKEQRAAAEPGQLQPTKDKASANVPLDSWVYATFDRMEALGYVQTGSAAVRPWTRLECARLLAEAHKIAGSFDSSPSPYFSALDQEFSFETSVLYGAANRMFRLESVYSRLTGIAGTPLRDSFHFAQTLSDDFGRPYGQGLNEVAGISMRAQSGPFAVYLRGEHQYASDLPTYNTTAQQAITTFDSVYLQGNLPFDWNLRSGVTDRIRLIEAYVSATRSNWQFSFGQQALWWGPDRSTSLILSNNAEAMPMLRIARVLPIRMPGKLAWLGPVHFDAFFARQGGIHYVALGPTFTLYGNAHSPLQPPPYLWGATFSFKPSQNFELGFAHTVIMAGYGRPLNFKTFLHSFSIIGNGQEIDPGKRTTEFNLSYHVPGFRRNLLVYNEALAWDSPVEGKFVARFAMAPGLYLPQFPGVHKMDLRMEGAYTDLPKLQEPAYYYANAHYPEGYTNYGQILGSWIGRQGRGGQVSSSYWFSPRNKATLTYRRMTVDKSMLQGGGLSDISSGLSWMIRPDLQLTTSMQYERWKFPLLEALGKTNITSSFEIKLFPSFPAKLKGK